MRLKIVYIFVYPEWKWTASTHKHFIGKYQWHQITLSDIFIVHSEHFCITLARLRENPFRMSLFSDFGMNTHSKLWVPIQFKTYVSSRVNKIT
jgi:hypothetical protein